MCADWNCQCRWCNDDIMCMYLVYSMLFVYCCRDSSTHVHQWYWQLTIPSQAGGTVGKDIHNRSNQFLYQQIYQNMQTIVEIQWVIHTCCDISNTSLYSQVLMPDDELKKKYRLLFWQYPFSQPAGRAWRETVLDSLHILVNLLIQKLIATIMYIFPYSPPSLGRDGQLSVPLVDVCTTITTTVDKQHGIYKIHTHDVIITSPTLTIPISTHSNQLCVMTMQINCFNVTHTHSHHYYDIAISTFCWYIM